MGNALNILIAATYYRPHCSGLTIYSERLAAALARRGHRVTVLTSRFDPSLRRVERRDGVTVVRLRPLMRVSKGLIMPSMLVAGWRLVSRADVVNLHTPQLDAAFLAWSARLLGKPAVLTYQCDLRLPRGFVHAVANQVSHIVNNIAAWSSRAITSITQDYAEHSAFLKRYLDKVHVMGAPVKLASVSDADIQAFRDKHGIQSGQPVIGVASRLAAEKGIEFLAAAMPAILRHYPDARVLFIGPYEHVVGEDEYAARVMPLILGLGKHWAFLGIIPDIEMSAFFKTIDVLVFPSLNSTEAFGLSQAEAMVCGTPVVVSDLPGVRVPVRETGMGLIVPPGDAGAIARGVIEILSHPDRFRGDLEAIRRRTSSDALAAKFEELFETLLEKDKKKKYI